MALPHFANSAEANDAKKSAKAKKVFDISWYVAHTPDNPRLIKQARNFARVLEERSKGRLRLDLKFPDQSNTRLSQFGTVALQPKTKVMNLSN